MLSAFGPLSLHHPTYDGVAKILKNFKRFQLAAISHGAKGGKSTKNAGYIAVRRLDAKAD